MYKATRENYLHFSTSKIATLSGQYIRSHIYAQKKCIKQHGTHGHPIWTIRPYLHFSTSTLPPLLANTCTAILIHIHMHQLTQQNCHPLCTTRSYWHFSTSKLPPSLANTYAATLIHKKHVSSNAANIVTPSGHHVHTCISALQNCHLL